ncbi:hypothetical protein CRUP_011218, partial [Coryphaenoides rupestris]
TFFYFLTSFVGLIVIPATYYLWPRDQNAEQLRLKSLRRVHGRCLWYRLRLMKSQQSIVPSLKKAALLFGWAVFLLLAYKVSKLDREYQEYNPYEVLNLDPGATTSEIKKQYHLLSKKFHPDKGGDEAAFMMITKAYAALTNEQTKKNWELYGDPDGPRATNFGIALPAWIVDQKNSMLVLLVYGLAFMVILPVVVGTWWYRSIRYSGDQILINTTQLFMHFMYKTPNMNMKRFCGLRRFSGSAAARIVEVPTQGSKVVRDAVQALSSGLAMVLTAAFEFDPRSNKDATIRPTDNIEVPQVDQRFVVRKSPALLQEMVNVGCQLTMMANSRGGCRSHAYDVLRGYLPPPPLTVLLKYKVRTLQDLVSLKDSERRSMLRFLVEEKYDEVIGVLGSFPYIAMETKLQVLDDEDSNNITAGSIVTVTVTLTRKRMVADASKAKTKVWQNKSKGTKKTAKSKKKKLTKKKTPAASTTTAAAAAAAATAAATAANAAPAVAAVATSKAKQANGNVAGSQEALAAAKEEDEEGGSDKGSESEEGEANKDSASERDDESDKQSDTEVDEIAGDDEEEWEALQQSIQRRERALLETKSKVTHPVYSLYYPDEKQEWWWLYIADRRDQALVSMPYHVELKFPAPSKTGNYQYSVILRSDSYLGLDQIKPLKLEVHEAKAVLDNHPQWDIPETEEEDEEQEDSDGIEESEDEDEDND